MRSDRVGRLIAVEFFAPSVSSKKRENFTFSFQLCASPSGEFVPAERKGKARNDFDNLASRARKPMSDRCLEGHAACDGRAHSTMGEGRLRSSVRPRVRSFMMCDAIALRRYGWITRGFHNRPRSNVHRCRRLSCDSGKLFSRVMRRESHTRYITAVFTTSNRRRCASLAD